jgi:4-hydroxy-4-methyl-2-oxoglutarate aldolase
VLGGSVNVPVTCAGELVRPGDVIVGDIDGVCVVRKEKSEEINDLALKKLQSEETVRARLKNGELGLDFDGGREKLAELGVEYIEDEADEYK